MTRLDEYGRLIPNQLTATNEIVVEGWHAHPSIVKLAGTDQYTIYRDNKSRTHTTVGGIGLIGRLRGKRE